ncbi:transcriptional regulator [Thiomicrorhabdus immobilis]|uniref:Transcriptional regulator n=1 Tax=Thiomicrorhabdus immobilis TaxID=2791037 RepID=A0ABN6CTQ3_9GAMM|nr:metalloregulator ArsR/SmtB family transcription factor [Thiomicrorhabdus immobilis]BCN92308.1 transcriptional regulator [Thiomicrorhabdus immobilis]
MSDTNLKICLFEQLAQIGKSLGHANRLLILDILAQSPSQVDTISSKLQLSVANVSKHLQQLKQAGLVINQVQGAQRIYQLSDTAIIPLIQAMRQIAENQMTEVANILNQELGPRAPLMPFNPKELKRALKTDQVQLLDVRPQDEYLAGHVEGAINIPIHQLAEKTPELNPQKPIIVYCRGPYCLWSYEAVEHLNKHKLQASRMAEGYPEWLQFDKE